MGTSLQPIGKIPLNAYCAITLKPKEQTLIIGSGKTSITLPYERIRSFSIENETTLAKSGMGLGGALVGGILFGGAGAIVGQNAVKGTSAYFQSSPKTPLLSLSSFDNSESVPHVPCSGAILPSTLQYMNYLSSY